MKNLSNVFSKKAAKSNSSWKNIKARLSGVLVSILVFVWIIGIMMYGRYFIKGWEKKIKLKKFCDELEKTIQKCQSKNNTFTFRTYLNLYFRYQVS
ncbi:MAG: hypothetical protein HKP59_03815 [Lutibacter sp.]|uniref:hypothetical protein n=1 Tax=Lutibacter sp. TaxID=1925666 RepID=UPI001792E415|nr:hypothetical protein [Lutibacter sp.]MBT8316728.1 hypothetical protein [Lutibacter sp.]NNJ57588.1 hypothetical protein [Lutibacter sp.]